VGPKAKKLYKKNKAIDTERRIVNHGKLTKKEKIEIHTLHNLEKDKYMLKNKGRYDCV
jgi:hypothetical protein